MATSSQRDLSTSTWSTAGLPAAHKVHPGPHGSETEIPGRNTFLRKAVLATAVFAVPPAAALALGAGASTAAFVLVLSLCAGSHLFMGHGGHGGRARHG